MSHLTLQDTQSAHLDPIINLNEQPFAIQFSSSVTPKPVHRGLQQPFVPKTTATQHDKTKDAKEIKISDERQEIYLKVLRKNVGAKCGKKAHQGD